MAAKRPAAPPLVPNERLIDGLILAVGIVLAAALRGSMLSYQTLDYHDFLSPWVDFIRQHGGFPALGYAFSNYTPPYLALLVISWLVFDGLGNLFIVKIISIAGDFLLAYFTARIVRLKYPLGSVPLFAFLAVLFFPTVLLNSALWGQADVLYTTGLVAAVYFVLRRRNWLAFVAWGLALAFKAQAAFLVPFFLILLVYRRVSWKHFLALPLVYLLAMLPGWIAGRPLGELLTIYLNQAETYPALTMNAPNLYQWLPNQQLETFLIPGLIGAGAAVFFFIVLAYKARLPLTDGLLLELALFSCLLLPFCLPKMHDRYFYPADIFALLCFFYLPRRYFSVLLLVELGSLLAYFPFLFGYEIVPLRYAAFLPLAAILLVGGQLARQANWGLPVPSMGEPH